MPSGVFPIYIMGSLLPGIGHLIGGIIGVAIINANQMSMERQRQASMVQEMEKDLRPVVYDFAWYVRKEFYMFTDRTQNTLKTILEEIKTNVEKVSIINGYYPNTSKINKNLQTKIDNNHTSIEKIIKTLRNTE